MDINISFSRALLAQVIPAVREGGYRPMKDGWVWNAGRDHWEFHGPEQFYWHGSADNAYEARYKGWVAFLRSKGTPVRMRAYRKAIKLTADQVRRIRELGASNTMTNSEIAIAVGLQPSDAGRVSEVLQGLRDEHTRG